MKKDKKWALKEIEKYLKLEGAIVARNALAYAKGVINQLDEPEVLSEEWIDEHAQGDYDEWVYTEDLQNLIVPKKEITYEDALKVIAENVGTDEFSVGLYLEALINGEKYEFLTEKWIEGNTSPVDDEGRLYVWKRDLQNLIVPKHEELESKIKALIKSYEQEDGRYSNPENAWIGEFIWDLNSLVDEEQKYYVYLGDGQYLVSEDELKEPHVKIRHEEDSGFLNYNTTFTEQEIKDYDPRYMAFAEPVEELEE